MQSMAQSGSSRFLTNRRSTSPFRPARATARFSVFAAKDGRVSEAGRTGDALIEIEVRPHPIFTRKGDDIYVELPISLKEAVLGGKVTVPTPSGAVTMTVPKWTNTGRVLRLKGKGVPRPDGGRGDEHVTLKVMLPETPDPELEKLIAQWRPTSVDAPSGAMGV